MNFDKYKRVTYSGASVNYYSLIISINEIA